MEKKSRIAAAILALAISCSPMVAQAGAQGGPPPGPPSSQQGQGNGPGDSNGGPGGGGFRRQMGPDGGGGQWNQMGRQGFAGGSMGRQWGRRGRMGHSGMGGRGMGRGFGQAGFLNNPAIRQRLGITADQTAKIRQQNSDFQKSMIRNRADLEVKRIELKDLLTADNPDRTAINAKLSEVSAAQMAQEKAGIDNLLAMRDILTPAQRQQLQQLRTNGFRTAGGGPPQTGSRGAQGPRPGGRRGSPPPTQGQSQSRQGQAPSNQ